MPQEIIRTLYSDDRTNRVTIYRRDDNTFGFRESRFSDDPMENCWITCHRHSESFCDSEETVIREVIGRVVWLGEMVACRRSIDGLPEQTAADPPPGSIDGAIVVCHSRIDQRHRYTGNCPQIRNGIAQGPVAALAICRYVDDDAFYLFGCNHEWKVITDTSHSTIDEAKRQAEFEYFGVTATWEIKGEPIS